MRGFSLLLLLVLLLAVHAAAAATELLCTDTPPLKEWFPAYNASRPLTDWSSTPQGWAACHAYSRATCCEKNHTDVVARVTQLMNNAQFAPACQKITEDVLCSLACDPDVGLGHKPAAVCAGTCLTWYAACQDEFVTPPASSAFRLPITPCLDSSLVCSQIKHMFSGGADEFCAAMAVREAEDCVPMRADEKRRGSPAPRPAFTPRPGSSSSSSTVVYPKWMPLAVVHFAQDVAAVVRPLSRWYMLHVDKLVKRHSIALLVLGICSLVFLALPLVVAARVRSSSSAAAAAARQEEEEENDDFKD